MSNSCWPQCLRWLFTVIMGKQDVTYKNGSTWDIATPQEDRATAIGRPSVHKIGEDWACSSGNMLADRHAYHSIEYSVTTSRLAYRWRNKNRPSIAVVYERAVHVYCDCKLALCSRRRLSSKAPANVWMIITNRPKSLSGFLRVGETWKGQGIWFAREMRKFFNYLESRGKVGNCTSLVRKCASNWQAYFAKLPTIRQVHGWKDS